MACINKWSRTDNCAPSTAAKLLDRWVRRLGNRITCPICPNFRSKCKVQWRTNVIDSNRSALTRVWRETSFCTILSSKKVQRTPLWVHGRRKDFFPREDTRGFFNTFLTGWAKTFKFSFSHSKPRKQPFFLKILKSRGVQDPPSPFRRQYVGMAMAGRMRVHVTSKQAGLLPCGASAVVE